MCIVKKTQVKRTMARILVKYSKKELESEPLEYSRTPSTCG
jgi:hypothetical protein